MIQTDIHIEDFDYALPEYRIAKHPLSERQLSKLLVFDNGKIYDASFPDIIQQIPTGAQVIFNNTKVVQARIHFFKPEAERPIEIFCLEPLDMDVQQAMAQKKQIDYTCLIGRAKKWKSGPLKIDLNGGSFTAERIEKRNDVYHVRFTWQGDLTFAEILDEIGKTPLPPYFKRDEENEDKQRYQTVYAKNDGSVAAPTAGLHFTSNILNKLTEKAEVLNATLHVGAGTFKPVQTSNIQEHDMHFEEVHLSNDFISKLLKHKGPRVAIGTTSVRSLESLYWLGVKLTQGVPSNELKQWEAYSLPQDISVEESLSSILNNLDGKDLFFKTQLMIVPGYTFKMLTSIVTNFHQPKSTLLLLVAAATKNQWQLIYEHALKNNYRFLSYGDSSIIHV